MSKSICKVRLLDEVAAVVVGLHGDHLDILYKKYSIPAPNYFFNPLFKLGRWDGKIHFMQANGRTYIYLLEEIIPRIVQMGYEIEIEDLRGAVAPSPSPIKDDMFADVLHPDTGKPTMLRYYQRDGINTLIENGFGIVKASTGAGKTILCTGLCKAYGDVGIKTLTIVPSQDLIKQTKKVYIHSGLDTGEYSGTNKDLNHDHVVSTWQALKNNPKIIELFQMVLVDECLSGDTLISMSDGSVKPIRDIVEGDRILSMNEITGDVVDDTVVKRHTNLTIGSTEKMYELVFDGGVTIHITGNHKMFTLNRGWVRADELVSDDDVVQQ